jgi:hypothetical protein
MMAIRVLLVALLLALGFGWPSRVEAADPTSLSGRLTEEVLDLTLPLTPGQARDVLSLLETPDRVVLDLADGVSAIAEALHRLPGAVAHDVLNAPAQLAGLVEALVADGHAIIATGREAPSGLFHNTLRALHRSAMFSTRAELLRRLTRPENKTVRLAVVVAARGQGIPLQTSDLDVVRRGLLDPDTADLAPVLAQALNRLVRVYGRDAVWILLTR